MVMHSCAPRTLEAEEVKICEARLSYLVKPCLGDQRDEPGVKVLAAKADDLHSILETHVVDSHKLSSNLCVCASAYTHTLTHTM